MTSTASDFRVRDEWQDATDGSTDCLLSWLIMDHREQANLQRPARLPKPARSPLTEGILANDGLLAIRPGGDDGDGHADECLQALQVFSRVIRQTIVAFNSHGALLPPCHVLVDSLALRKVSRQ